MATPPRSGVLASSIGRMKLYLIQADLSYSDRLDQFERLDLFAWANDPREARDHWRDYYADRDRPPLVMVCEVPPAPGAGVVRWSDMQQVILQA